MTHTGARVWQWVGIILILCLFGGAYWYFEVRAGYKTNVSPTGSLTSGLVGYWTFDGADVSGTTATDRSGNSNTGTLVNGPTATPGKLGQALNFDGTNDKVVFPAITTGTTFTLSIWAKPNAQTDTYGTLLIQETGSKFGFSYRGTAAGANAGKISYYDIGGDHMSNTTITDGVWSHVVVAVNAGSLQFYINGVPSGTASSITSLNLSNIGDDGLSETFKGSLDEVRVYNRALTASEIQSLYAFGQSDEINTGASQSQGTGRLDSGLAGYWKLDDGSGTSATDASTNANTGTLTNGPTWTTGQIGGAVDFDGTDDYIIATGPVATGEVSVFAWIKPTSVSSWQGIMGDVTSGDTPGMYNLEVGRVSGKIDANWNGSFTNFCPGNSSVIAGVWTHVGFVRSGSSGNWTCKLYINGALDNTTTGITNNPSNSLNFTIGKTGTRLLAGSVDEAHVYNRSLSPDEVSQLYRLTSPTGTDTSLKGYWSFNGKDVSGTMAYDRSGAGNAGTLTNGPTVTPGKLGQALNFDGTNDSVVLSTSTIFKPSQFTVSTWGYAETGSATYRGIFLPSYADGYNSGFLFYINNDGHAAVRYGNGSAPVGNITSGESVLGGWHYLVTTFDGTTLTLFVDGVEKVSTTASTLAYIGSATTAQIGAGNGTDTFDGKLDEFRLYSRALTAVEIQSQYAMGQSDEVNTGASQAQGGSRLDSGLAGYWKLDDGSGTSATDASTNGNTGTLANGPTWTTGQVGGAVDLDGTNDYIATNATLPSKGTVSIWVNPNFLLAPSGLYDIFYGITSGNLFRLRANTFAGFDGYEMTIRGSFGTQIDIQGPVYTSDAQIQGWHHLVATWDTTLGVSLYIDGTLAGSNGTSTNSFDAMTLGIGGTTDFWKGKMDEVRLYSRMFSADEVSQLYRLTAPTGTDTSLKGYWSFNGKDVSGTTAYDRSGAGNTGTLTNGPTVTPGKVGQALRFDGVNDYIRTGNTTAFDSLFSSGITVCSWVKYTNLLDYNRTITINDNANTSYDVWLQSVITDGKIEFGAGGVGKLKRSTTGVVAGIWYYVCGETDYTSGGTKIFINGVDDGGTVISTPTYTADKGSLDIGVLESSGKRYGAGVFDEVRVYNRALTATEIASLYNSGK